MLRNVLIEANVPLDLSGRSDLRLKHQVELDGIGQFVASLWVDDGVLLDDLSKLRAGKVVDLRDDARLAITPGTATFVGPKHVSLTWAKRLSYS